MNKMARSTRELAWDYTDTSPQSNVLFGSNFETRPLLQPSSNGDYFQSEDLDSPVLSQNQIKQLLQNLESSALVLRQLLQNENPATESQEELVTTSQIQEHVNNARCSPCATLWWLPDRIAKHLFIITVLLQAANIAIISITDELDARNQERHHYIEASCAVMIILEVTNLILLIITSVRLTQQMLAHRVSSVFLAQSYFATVLVFAGLYTVTYRFQRSSWKDVSEDINKDPVLVVTLYLKMLFLSVSTATLCGSSAVTPKLWYNYVLVSVQMLLSFLYFAQILAQAMGFSTEPSVGSGPLRLSNQRDASRADRRLRQRPASRLSDASYDNLSIASENGQGSLTDPGIANYGTI